MHQKGTSKNDSTLFETANRIYARPQALSAKTTVDSILRNGKTPVYQGNFEIEKTQIEGDNYKLEVAEEQSSYQTKE